MLAECDVQKFSVDIAAGEAGVIFDLKGSLHFDDSNVAVLWADGVESASWSGSREAFSLKFQAFPVGASALTRTISGLWRMWVGAISGQELVVEAQVISIWLGNVDGGNDAPPDYIDDSADYIQSRLYQWDTVASPLSWTHVE